MSIRNKAWRIIIASFVFFVVCQLSTLAFLPKIIVCNSGISFSINIPVFVLIPAIAISLFCIGRTLQTTLRKKTSGYLAITSGSLFFGGALSNIADRILRGCVPDFFHISFFPTLNVADIGISAGALLLFTLLIREKIT